MKHERIGEAQRRRLQTKDIEGGRLVPGALELQLEVVVEQPQLVGILGQLWLLWACWCRLLLRRGFRYMTRRGRAGATGRGRCKLDLGCRFILNYPTCSRPTAFPTWLRAPPIVEKEPAFQTSLLESRRAGYIVALDAERATILAFGFSFVTLGVKSILAFYPNSNYPRHAKLYESRTSEC